MDKHTLGATYLILVGLVAALLVGGLFVLCTAFGSIHPRIEPVDQQSGSGTGMGISYRYKPYHRFLTPSCKKLPTLYI